MSDFDFLSCFKKMLNERRPGFDIAGLITKDRKIYPFSTDTKVLSTIFEMLIRPYVYEFASRYGFQIFEPAQQNFYPDFTFMRDEKDKAKIALDVKTTYRRFKQDGTWLAGFTLGSFASFMRNDTKNIAFPYSDYAGHYIMGFIYTRQKNIANRIYTPDRIDAITPTYSAVEYFIQEKYKIAGDVPGSGNTENICSFSASSIEEFSAGRGPFSTLGKKIFEEYWRGYPRYRKKGKYKSLDEFLAIAHKEKK